MNYPCRDSHFAHRFVRLLQKSCAAQDIGQTACLLLVYIAHTEDAARYSGPVRFWNEQLMSVMGFKSPKQLNDARQRAVDAGWLAYERNGNREVGRYFVIVPAGFEGLDDRLIEDNRSVNHSENGMNSGTNSGKRKERIAERIGDELRNEKVTESGKPSIPNPNPNPVDSPKVGSPPVGPVFSCIGKGASQWRATEEQLADWGAAFPFLDIRNQLARANAWIEADPKRRKTAGGMARFLVGWLSRSEPDREIEQQPKKPTSRVFRPGPDWDGGDIYAYARSKGFDVP